MIRVKIHFLIHRFMCYFGSCEGPVWAFPEDGKRILECVYCGRTWEREHP